MVENAGDGLSRRERQIMDVIFARGSATAAEVVSALPDPPTKTAIRTLMRILEEKGHLKHELSGREFVYQPTQARTRAAQSAFHRVLKTFFEGSLEKAVAAHLAGPTAKLSPAELERLADLIQQARSKRKQP
ncbi:MAG TPA: BlaI/MecI/CopY family transcriptional regulator [Pirellulaceae bacterium]